MCGRMVCTLSKDQVQKACSVMDPATMTYQPLEWEEASNGGHEYTPSCNICPTNVTPVLVKGTHGLVCKPMLWGIIPPWHKGEYNSHKLSTNNCRIENIGTSKLYNPPMQRGQRCVVVCDGFYEWQTTKKEKNKQPYFIYAPQREGIDIDSPKTWPETFSANQGWAGPRLLYMAALFSSWTSSQGEQFFTYSIITMESNTTLSWLHHRMPAILETDAKVLAWINQGKCNANEALSVLEPTKTLKWHPVSTDVNNSRNKSSGLNKAINLSVDKQSSKSSELMKSWLLKGPTKRHSDENDIHEPSEKKQKSS